MNLYDEALAIPMSDIREAYEAGDKAAGVPIVESIFWLKDVTGEPLPSVQQQVHAGYLHPVAPEVFAPILLEHIMSGPEGILPALKYFDLKTFAQDCIDEGRMLPVQYQGRTCVVEPASV